MMFGRSCRVRSIEMDRKQLSVTIITLNEERRIGKCIKSVSFADEIIVVDSGSQDRTVEIAEQAGARVIHQDWLGYGRQKQFAVEQAINDWVLCLDADEWLSPELLQSIQSVLEHPEFRAYQFPRRNRFMGRWLRHGEGYPDWSLRLFDRNHAHWSEDVVHEKVVPDGEIGKVSGDLMHESEDGLQHYLEKQKRYALILSRRKTKLGGAPLLLLFSPLFRFTKTFIFRRGFLDGYQGLVHCLMGATGSYYKYWFVLKRLLGLFR